jgi:N-acetylmuramoyl-L-alanine amidase
MHIKFIVILAIYIMALSVNFYGTTPAKVYGSVMYDDTVKTVQDKLKTFGYYNGYVDGIYDINTIEAIKLFQKANNLIVDGVIGSQTLTAIDIFESTSLNGESIQCSENDAFILACIISGEARGEIYLGKVAVGAVILNRIKNEDFPNTLLGVIYQPGAFHAVYDGQINIEPCSSCIEAAKEALEGNDPTGGAVYYWNPRTATNQWMLTMPVTITIGNHCFGISK